ncbi:unnamed protein product [marine sediment metagenome]|uniref:Uncharacterized protein n=1 Tax=marine sediment metagenome TaxID=412755 RepID=X1JX41_9ZZZZ
MIGEILSITNFPSENAFAAYNGGGLGSLFFDSSNDLGIKSRGPDSIYNKGRDIEKVHIKNSPQYLDFTLIHRHIFNEPGRLNLFITLDIDTYGKFR